MEKLFQFEKSFKKLMMITEQRRVLITCRNREFLTKNSCFSGVLATKKHFKLISKNRLFLQNSETLKEQIDPKIWRKISSPENRKNNSGTIAQ